MFPMDASSVGPGGLSGYALILLICGLLVVEEVGVPLFFVPGDFLLVLAGVTTATAHLNPIVVVAATTGSVVVGALAGRELFDRLGRGAVRRVARLLHVSGRLDRLAARLRCSGAPAVFLGRVTPGLRVHTTEAAGLVGMRRRSFVAGLVPAVAVYEAVFVGLGAWLGPTAWSTIQQYVPKLGPLLVLVAIVAGVLLAWGAIVRWLGGRPSGHSGRVAHDVD